MSKQILFHKKSSGYLVRVIKSSGVWRCNIFAPSGQFTSCRFSSAGAAVAYAQFFISSLSGSPKNNQQLKFF